MWGGIVYVENLSEEFRSINLLRSVASIGDVGEVFLSKRKNKANKRFGFLKFSREDKAKEAIQFLDGKILAGNHISANMARFGDKSNLDVHKAHSSSRKTIATGNRQPYSRNGSLWNCSRQPGFSFKQALLSNGNTFNVSSPTQGAKQDTMFSRCVGSSNSAYVCWLQKSLIVVSLHLKSCKEVLENLLKLGLENITVKRFGDCLFLLTFSDQSVFSALEKKNWAPLMHLFLRCFKWTPSFNVRKRVTRISIKGLPWHAWTMFSVNNVLKNWGEVLQIVNNLEKDEDIEELRILALIDEDQFINESIWCVLDETPFKVSIVESSSHWFNKDTVLIGDSIRRFPDGRSSDWEMEKLAEVEGSTQSPKAANSHGNSSHSPIVAEQVLHAKNLNMGQSNSIHCQGSDAVFETSKIGEKCKILSANKQLGCLLSANATSHKVYDLDGSAKEHKFSDDIEVSGPSVPPGFEVLIGPVKNNFLMTHGCANAGPSTCGETISLKARDQKLIRNSKGVKQGFLFRRSSSFSSSFLSGRARRKHSKRKSRALGNLETEEFEDSSNSLESTKILDFLVNNESSSNTVKTPIHVQSEDTCERGIEEEALETWKVGKLLGLKSNNEMATIKELAKIIRRDKFP